MKIKNILILFCHAAFVFSNNTLASDQLSIEQQQQLIQRLDQASQRLNQDVQRIHELEETLTQNSEQIKQAAEDLCNKETSSTRKAFLKSLRSSAASMAANCLTKYSEESIHQRPLIFTVNFIKDLEDYYSKVDVYSAASLEETRTELTGSHLSNGQRALTRIGLGSGFSNTFCSGLANIAGTFASDCGGYCKWLAIGKNTSSGFSAIVSLYGLAGHHNSAREKKELLEIGRARVLLIGWLFSTCSTATSCFIDFVYPESYWRQMTRDILSFVGGSLGGAATFDGVADRLAPTQIIDPVVRWTNNLQKLLGTDETAYAMLNWITALKTSFFYNHPDGRVDFIRPPGLGLGVVGVKFYKHKDGKDQDPFIYVVFGDLKRKVTTSDRDLPATNQFRFSYRQAWIPSSSERIKNIPSNMELRHSHIDPFYISQLNRYVENSLEVSIENQYTDEFREKCLVSLSLRPRQNRFKIYDEMNVHLLYTEDITFGILIYVKK